MKARFITAYQFLCGSTRREAEAAWRRSDDMSRNLTIAIFEGNAAATFSFN